MKLGLFVIIFSLMLGFIALLDSCKNDATPSANETITTMKVIAQNLTSNTTDTFTYVNFNESKPNPPAFVDTIRLHPKTAYAIQIALINDLNHQTVTDTIIAKADSHLMIYNIDPTQLMTVKILDKDSKGLPLGMFSTWTTSDSTNGWLRMILRHQQGNKNGTENPGSNDFEADFPVSVR